MIRILTYVLFSLVALNSIATADATIKAQVVNVLAGDILVVSIDHEAEVVHLFGVQVPERGQPGWREARDYTRQMVLQKQIVLQSVGRGRDGNMQARVYLGDTCINDALADVLLAHKQGHDPA